MHLIEQYRAVAIKRYINNLYESLSETFGIIFSIFLDFVKIMVILSPTLWIFFHFIDNDNINKTKKKITTNVCNQICTDSEDEDFVDNSETLLRYEKMKKRFFTRIE
ncbi:MAG: hypothetical protein U9R27_12380 [Campylobacterota bacterium]|nr:hypothetical protein [Campylobacterota bacterium]